MPRVGRPQVDHRDGLVHAKFTGELKNAVLGFTTAAKWQNKTLNSIPCRIVKNELIANNPLPKGTTAYMINARASGVWNDGCIDSLLIEVQP